MIVESYNITNELSLLINKIWYVSFDKNDKNHKKSDIIVPSGCINLVLNFKDDYYLIDDNKEYKLPNILLTGILDHAYKIQYGNTTKQIGLVITPIGFLSIFHSSSTLFKNTIIDCSNEKWNLLELYDLMKNIEDFKHMVDILINKYKNNNSDSKAMMLLQDIITEMNLAQGSMSLIELSQKFNYSQSGFERFFKKMTGITPKSYLNIIKFKNAVESKERDHYYDQSHYIKSLKRYTGKTPSEMNKECHEITLNYILKNADFLQYK